MFFTLLLVMFGLALSVSFIVARLFKRPIGEILHRIIKASISSAWQKYITFATYVFGISGGVRIYQLERYLEIPTEAALTLELTTGRWSVGVFSTSIGTLRSIAWMYRVIFIVALIAYVIVGGSELKSPEK